MKGLPMIALALVLAAPAGAAAPTRWIGSWASAQQIPEEQNALPPADMTDATLRQIVHVSIGGPAFRIRLSNAFGTEPLTIDDVHVARARSSASARIDPASDRVVTFDGERSVTIPAGADYWSDPIPRALAPLSDLAVSFHVAQAPARQTSHPGSRATSYIVQGDKSAAPDLPGARTVEHWFNLSGVEVAAGPQASAVVALGDSITDGHGSTTNGNDRWPDDLARRIAAAGKRIGVLNAGIGGNRLLLDGLGPNALARFDRDVLAQPGVRTVILLEGVNDLGTAMREHPISPEAHKELVRAIIGAYSQIAERAHAHGIRVLGATITPYVGSDYYHPAAAAEADRQAINRWIRTSGAFDAVIDFDRAVRDPAHPERMLPAYDSGDHLHPSPAGYRVMAAAVPIGELAR